MPTWNYVSVHVHGEVRSIDDATWLRQQVGELTGRHESNMESPWSISDAPADYVDKMLRGIVGIEMSIQRIEAKAKLSQNRPAEDVAGVIEGLAELSVRPSLSTTMATW